MTEKKQSLFKQKMAESKNKVVEKGFPKVIKIDTKQQQQPVPQQAKQKIQTKKPMILDQMKQSKLISQKEYDEIDKQNKKTLEGLSEKQILQYQQELMATLPPEFINKLHKLAQKKAQGTESHTTEEDIEERDVVDQLPQTKTQSAVEEQKTQKPKDDKQLQQEALATIMYRLSTLAVNLKTKGIEVCEDTEEREDAINLIKIQRMIFNENNQSLTMGLVLLYDFLLEFSKLDFTEGVVAIDGLYWHRSVVLDYVAQRFMETLYQQLLKNKSRTCRLELLKVLIIAICVGCPIGEDIVVRVTEEAKQEGELLHEAITTLENKNYKFTQPWLTFRAAMQKWQLNKYMANMVTLVERVILQHFYFSNRIVNGKAYETEARQIVLYFRQYAKAQQKIHLLEFFQYLLFLSRFVEVCEIKLLLQDDMQIRRFLKWLGNELSDFLRYLVDTTASEVSKSLANLYRVLLLSFMLLPFQDYTKLFRTLDEKLNSTDRKLVQSVLFMINPDQYIAEQWDNFEIGIVEDALTAIASWCDDGTVVCWETLFFRLIRIFQHEHESYQKLNQDLMNSAFNKILARVNPLLMRELVTLMKVKNLVKSYIYNSFGNKVFSNVLLYLSSGLFSVDVQVHIISECYQRYPFIFYESTQDYGLYANLQLYNPETRLEPVKNELAFVKPMLQDQPGCHSNPFFKLLG